MTDNRVQVSETGANKVNLHLDVAAGAQTEPPPGVSDDTPVGQRLEDRLISAGRDATAPTEDEDTVRRELDASGATNSDPADNAPQDNPADTVGQAIATRGISAAPGD